MSPGPELPIVCTLGAADLPERLDRWRRLVDTAGSRETSPDGERLIFAAEPGLAARIADLCETEHGCCGFFRFGLSIAASEVTLEVSAPPDARVLVHQLLAGA